MAERKSVVPATVSLGLILVPLVLSIAAYVFGKESEGDSFLAMPADTSAECVESAEYMRFHHMDLLKEQRDKAVREGRPSGVTFDACKQCHQKKEQFCDRCHEAASVRLDCFECHDDETE